METKVEILYPAPMLPMTEKERAASDAAIAKIRASGHPLAQYAGIFRDDPTYDAYLAAIRDYRREVEEDSNH